MSTLLLSFTFTLTWPAFKMSLGWCWDGVVGDVVRRSRRCAPPRGASWTGLGLDGAHTHLVHVLIFQCYCDFMVVLSCARWAGPRLLLNGEKELERLWNWVSPRRKSCARTRLLIGDKAIGVPTRDEIGEMWDRDPMFSNMR